jgi:hypothetical protein
MRESVAPRPNVASGAAVGLLTALVLAWLQFYQTGVNLPNDIPLLLATFSPLVGAIVAYYAPAYDKVKATAIALAVCVVLIILLALLLNVALTMPLIVAIIVAALQLLATAAIPNRQPTP